MTGGKKRRLKDDVQRSLAQDANRRAQKDAHRDPFTKEPGSHPLGTAAGSTAGAAAGAAIGAAVSGPAGALVGGALGAIAGGAAGHSAAEKVNPTVEDAYWRDNYTTRPYVQRDADYEEYRPAYRYGWESRDRHAGRDFDEVEDDLERGWEQARGRSRLSWQDAKHATRDAWKRIEEKLPGKDDQI
jgi:hypothetical protein